MHYCTIVEQLKMPNKTSDFQTERLFHPPKKGRSKRDFWKSEMSALRQVITELLLWSDRSTKCSWIHCCHFIDGTIKIFTEMRLWVNFERLKKSVEDEAVEVTNNKNLKNVIVVLELKFTNVKKGWIMYSKLKIWYYPVKQRKTGRWGICHCACSDMCWSSF